MHTAARQRLASDLARERAADDSGDVCLEIDRAQGARLWYTGAARGVVCAATAPTTVVAEFKATGVRLPPPPPPPPVPSSSTTTATTTAITVGSTDAFAAATVVLFTGVSVDNCIVVSTGSWIRTYQLPHNTIVAEAAVDTATGTVVAVELTRDGQWVVCASSGGSVRVLDSRTLGERARLQVPNFQRLQDACLGTDGWAYVCGTPSQVAVLCMKTEGSVSLAVHDAASVLVTCSERLHGLGRIQVSADRTLLAVATTDAVRVVSGATLQVLHTVLVERSLLYPLPSMWWTDDGKSHVLVLSEASRVRWLRCCTAGTLAQPPTFLRGASVPSGYMQMTAMGCGDGMLVLAGGTACMRVNLATLAVARCVCSSTHTLSTLWQWCTVVPQLQRGRVTTEWLVDMWHTSYASTTNTPK